VNEVQQVWSQGEQSASDGEALSKEASGEHEEDGGPEAHACAEGSDEEWQVLPALWRVSRVSERMAKRKGKGKRKGSRKSRGKKKVGRKAAKHSLALEAAAVWDGYKFVTASVNGQSFAQRAMGAVGDPAQRAVLKGELLTPGSALRRNAVSQTKELQMVAIFKVAQKVPLIKGPANMAANAINSLGRQFGIKGRYKVV
jgi:hypothetical protein